MQAEVERAERFLRSYRSCASPWARWAPTATRPTFPSAASWRCGPDGEVARAGASREVQAGRLVVPLAGLPRPGPYTVLLALYVSDNTVNPQITTVSYRPEGNP